MTLPTDFDPIYLIYGLVAAATVLVVEAVYLLFFSAASLRRPWNIPQSSRMRSFPVVRRCMEPVTSLTAP